MPIGNWGTVTEAAAHFGLSRQRVWRLVQRGALGEARLVDLPRGNVWMIPYPFERATLKTGRPMKKRRKES